jgi:hypothetical protein
MKISLLLFVIGGIPIAAIAQEKQLDPVQKVRNIEKTCRAYFATTTFGGGKDTFLIYRFKGAERNNVTRQSDAQSEIKDVNPPTAEEVEPGKWIFRMNATTVQEAAPCLTGH